MARSVRMQPITPRAEQSRREPKNVVTPLAPGSGVEKMSVPNLFVSPLTGDEMGNGKRRTPLASGASRYESRASGAVSGLP
jgi:hypothetical protein